MHPDAVPLADVGDGVQVVEGAQNRRAAGGAHEERDAAVTARALDLRLEVRQQDLASVTDNSSDWSVKSRVHKL